jgi:hypothetical protein
VVILVAACILLFLLGREEEVGYDMLFSYQELLLRSLCITCFMIYEDLIPFQKKEKEKRGKASSIISHFNTTLHVRILGKNKSNGRH